MPRYFFNLCKDGRPPDLAGAELQDLAHARREASRQMAEEMKAQTDQFLQDEEWRIEISDETGLILFTVFGTAVESAAGRG
ncbi:DUF6894 family protein [Lichenifustis flavocetrariae]|uniref:DUF6894 domain-containing protein n=1 Tax=Lichenifustis flavocetrariae TaxID=2949735 RepID=A0AA42CKR0_9HYPH|nr:hypothetical protein [Lichenifustis flavocetrariae]MCW6506617.1 hypothetical protein [Lichenifustis flavocetrariae]